MEVPVHACPSPSQALQELCEVASGEAEAAGGPSDPPRAVETASDRPSSPTATALGAVTDRKVL